MPVRFARYSTHRILSIMPVAYAAFRFGFRGGLISSIAIALLLLPRVMASPQRSESVIEVAAFFVIGCFVSWLIDAQKRGKEERQQAIAQLEQAQERLRFYIQQVTRAQEDERHRIARDLHDETVQSLIVLSRRLELVQGQSQPGSAKQLRELRQQVDDILRGIRRLGQELRPSILDNLGLVAAARWLASCLATQFRLDVQVEVVGEDRRLAPDTEVALFRIAQEALTNIRKHAGVSSAEVRVEFSPSQVTLTIQDSGCGFQPPPKMSDLALFGKLGLIGMQEWSHLVKGTFTLSSQPGRGTEIAVSVPDGSAQPSAPMPVLLR